MPDRPAHPTRPVAAAQRRASPPAKRCCHKWAALAGLVSLISVLLAPAPLRGSELRQTPIVKAVQSARPSVVNIRGEKTVSATSTRPGRSKAAQRVNGMGTGVVIDSRGYILTNFHVVDGVRRIQVTFADGKQCVARRIARDLETDLAVIKVDVSGKLPVISVGTSSDLMPGEPVVAVGNAYGYEHTVTRGIISALHRAVQVSEAQFYDDLIQTDASINPGNSGGPLLNIDGEMIGINVAVRAGAQGIGFAIPSDKAWSVAANLLASASGKRTWHGVVPDAGSAAGRRGAVVASVDKKSPAAAGGLEAKDVITAVGDFEIERVFDFRRAMLERKVGEKIQLTVRRSGGEPLMLRLTLAGPPLRKKQPAHPSWRLLGLELKPIPVKRFRQEHHTRYRGGLTVVGVRPGSPAAAQGIRRGDVLVGMHIWETISMENVSYILKRPDFATLNPIKFFILRGNETLYGYLPVTAKTARRK